MGAQGSKETSGWPPLHLAVICNDEDKVLKLMKGDPGCINTRGSLGELAIHMAALHGRMNLLHILAAGSADKEETLHQQDDLDNTSLHWAAYRGEQEAAHWLIKISPRELYVPNKVGQLPADVARDEGHTTLSASLRDKQQRYERVCSIHLYRRKHTMNLSSKTAYTWVLLFEWPNTGYEEAYEAIHSEENKFYQCCNIGHFLPKDLEKYDICKASDCTPHQVQEEAAECGALNSTGALKLLADSFDVKIPNDATEPNMIMNPEVMACEIWLYRRKIQVIAFHWAVTFTWSNDQQATYEALQSDSEKLYLKCNTGPPKICNEYDWKLYGKYTVNDCSPLQVHDGAKQIRIDGICIGDEHTSKIDYKFLTQNCQKFAQLLAENFGAKLPDGAANWFAASSCLE